MKEKTYIDINYKLFDNKNYKDIILILHGWGGKSDSWIKVGELLNEKGYKVIIPDLPGFGKTRLKKIFNLDDYADIIIDFVTGLGIKNFILLGHSNGGAISIKIENKHLLKIKKLILNNSAGIRDDSKRNIKRKTIGFFAKIFKPLGSIPFFRKIFYKIIGGQDYINSEKIPFLKETYKNIISEDLKNEIQKIKTNTLIVWGENDTYTPKSDGEYMYKNIKGAKYVLLDNEKHRIHLQNPERLVFSILNNI